MTKEKKEQKKKRLDINELAAEITKRATKEDKPNSPDKPQQGQRK